VHRDIKPQNILIDQNNTVKISDMGFAKKLEGEEASMSGSRGGSVGWQPPELISSRDSLDQSMKITKQADIFSAGCVFYYVLTQGDHPFGDM
jgi:serine/threonine-protein kinase/endoribonuclease IRE1